MKVICEEVIGGETVLRSYTTTQNGAAVFVKLHPGVGNKFWAWPSIPAGTLTGADFTNAPTATSVTATNQSLIDAITALPADVLVYA